MKTDPPSRSPERDLQDALIAWQAGPDALPTGRAQELLHRIQEDESLRRELASLIATLALTRAAQAPEPRWLALSEAIGLQDFPATDEALDQAVLAAIQTEQGPPPRDERSWLLLGGIIGSGALALVCGMLFLTLRPTQDPHLAASLAVVLHSPPGDPPFQARAGGRQILEGQSVSRGPLSLDQGHLSLMFPSGAVLHLEGPAQLELRTTDRVMCHAGRVRLQVPPGAEGFCIETPSGVVTDLGTELGVSVGKDGLTHVAVFEGEAEASVRLPGQEGVRTEWLGAADAVLLRQSTGEILPHTAAPGDFLPRQTLHIPPLPLESEYAEMIQKSAPTHYWRLSRLSDGSFPNEIAQAPPLRIAGKVTLTDAGTGSSTAAFAGKSQPGALYTEADAWSPSGPAHAVEFWFASTSADHAALAALTTGPAPRDHLELVELALRKPGRSPRSGIVRYLSRWPAGNAGGINIYSEPEFQPYQWHHVVAQQSSGHMELYINGNLVGRAQGDAAPAGTSCRVQFGSLRYFEGLPTNRLDRPFAGNLAEIALYDRLLTKAEIQQHWAAGRPRSTAGK